MVAGVAPPERPFDGFLIGPENALAHAGVQALARGEGGLSPMVLHGPAGSGKTRLLSGLVHEFLARRPGSSAAHLSAEEFASCCASARTIDDWAEVRRRFRFVDLFAIDDLHALDRAPLAMDELARTLDALEASGAPVAVTARSGPGQWSGWPARLISRLSGGLAARLDLPGVDARRGYLLEQSRARGVPIASAAADLLAEAADGYRTLDGWLGALALRAKVGRRPIDRLAAETFLAGPDAPEPPGLDEIAGAVARKFGLHPRELRAARRGRAVVEPRHLAMHLARRYTRQSFARIGAYFGGRDPKTVRHACDQAERRLAGDPALAAVADAIGRRWKEAGPLA
ncbi:MAG: DnaA/Hda family protein [Isosphaeraceae bacterium]